MASYLLASYGAFGVMGSALFGFGVGVAVERGQGWLLLKRASPMPPGAYLLAKLCCAAAFGVTTLGLMALLGVLFGGVRLAAPEWLSLFAVIALGSLALGLLFGLLPGPTAAAPIVNLIYLPLAFASGMWIPIQFLPSFFKGLAPALPSYHLAQLGASQGGSVAVPAGVLAGFTLVCLALARVAYLREEAQRWG